MVHSLNAGEHWGPLPPTPNPGQPRNKTLCGANVGLESCAWGRDKITFSSELLKDSLACLELGQTVGVGVGRKLSAAVRRAARVP